VGLGAGNQNPYRRLQDQKVCVRYFFFVWEVCSYGANRDEAEGANREWQ
jgi:hypothetical protein